MRSTTRRRRIVGLAAAAAVAVGGVATGLLTGAGTASAAILTGDASAKADDGSYVVSQTLDDDPISGQYTIDMLIASKAIGTNVHATVILPKTWLTATTKTYPTLYLLSGSSADNQDWKDWITSAPLQAAMANQDVLTVLPQDGNAGFYTNWVGTSKVFPGKPQWETFHTVELPQLLSRGYRANGTNVIGGVSEAGIGVVDYVADNPGLYKAAAVFSGFLDLQALGAPTIVTAAEQRANDNGDGPFGNSNTNAANWKARNPMNRAADFAKSNAPIWFGVGNGLPGPGDYSQAFDMSSFVFEQAASGQMNSLASKMTAAGVKVTKDAYGAGKHDWPAWIRAWPSAWSSVIGPGLGVS